MMETNLKQDNEILKQGCLDIAEELDSALDMVKRLNEELAQLKADNATMNRAHMRLMFRQVAEKSRELPHLYIGIYISPQTHMPEVYDMCAASGIDAVRKDASKSPVWAIAKDGAILETSND